MEQWLQTGSIITMESINKPDPKLTSILDEATAMLSRGRRPKTEGEIAPEKAAPGVKRAKSAETSAGSARVDPSDTAPGVKKVAHDTAAASDHLPGEQAQSSHESAELEFSNLGEEDFFEELERLQNELGEEGGALDGDDDDDEQYGKEDGGDGEDQHQMQLSPDEDPEAGQEMGPGGPEDAEHPEMHPEHPDMGDGDPEMQADGVDGMSDPMAEPGMGGSEPGMGFQDEVIPVECPNCGEQAIPQDMECMHCGAELPMEQDPNMGGEGGMGEPGMEGGEEGGEGDMMGGGGPGGEMDGMEPMSDADAMGNNDDFNGNSGDGLSADPFDPMHGHPDESEPVESLGEATESLRAYAIRANKGLTNASKWIQESVQIASASDRIVRRGSSSAALLAGGTQAYRAYRQSHQQMRESLLGCGRALAALRKPMAVIIEHSRSLEEYAGRGDAQAHKVESYVRRHKLRSFLSDTAFLSEAAMGMNKSFRMGSHNSAIAYMNRMAQRASHLADVAKGYLKTYKGTSHPKIAGAVDNVRNAAHSAYGHAKNAAGSMGRMARSAMPRRSAPREMETHMESRSTSRRMDLNEEARMLYEADNPSAEGEDPQTMGTQEVPQQVAPSTSNNASTNTLEIPSHNEDIDMGKREAFEATFLKIFAEALRQEEANGAEQVNEDEIACSACNTAVNEEDEQCGNCGAEFEA